MNRRVARPLRPEEMVIVRAVIPVGESPVGVFLNGVNVVFDLLLADVGESLDDYGPERRLVPGEYAIPEGQVTEIVTLMIATVMERWGGDAAAALMMEWVNVGPGGMTDKEMEIWESRRGTRLIGTRGG